MRACLHSGATHDQHPAIPGAPRHRSALSLCRERRSSAPSYRRSDLRGGSFRSRGSNIRLVASGTLGGSFSATYAINDLNQIVGASTNAENERGCSDGRTAFHGSGSVAGKNGSQATTSMRRGRLWDSFGGTGQARAFRRTPGTCLSYRRPQDTAAVKPMESTMRGRLLAWSAYRRQSHAAIWRDGLPTDLQAAGTGEGFAWDISNTGQVAGNVLTDFETGASRIVSFGPLRPGRTLGWRSRRRGRTPNHEDCWPRSLLGVDPRKETNLEADPRAEWDETVPRRNPVARAASRIGVSNGAPSRSRRAGGCETES